MSKDISSSGKTVKIIASIFKSTNSNAAESLTRTLEGDLASIYVHRQALLTRRRHALANPEQNRLTWDWLCGRWKGWLTIGHSPKSLFLELQHLVREAHSLLPYDIFAGHPHVIEKHLRCIRGPHAHFIDLPCNVNSLKIVRMNKKLFRIKFQRFLALNEVLPGRFMGKQIRDLFLCGGSLLVLARRHIQSAWVPLVVHIFPPLMMNSSPLRTALVFMPGGEGIF